MYTTNCPKCNGKMVSTSTMQTLVGYFSPPGHNHDDNCRKRSYICQDCSSSMVVSKQNKCSNPNCDWIGKDECWCHPEKKVKEWPKEYN